MGQLDLIIQRNWNETETNHAISKNNKSILNVDDIIKKTIEGVFLSYDIIEKNKDEEFDVIRKNTKDAYDYSASSVIELVTLFNQFPNLETEILDRLEEYDCPYKHSAGVKIKSIINCNYLNRYNNKNESGKSTNFPYSVGNPVVAGIAGEWHDIGKIFIDQEIIKSPNKLDHDNAEIIKEHPIIACQLLDEIANNSVLYTIFWHHFDLGNGYPKGLETPRMFENYFFPIIEKYDALRCGNGSGRLYKNKLNMEESLIELDKMEIERKIHPQCYQSFKYFLREMTTEGRELLSGPLRLND